MSFRFTVSLFEADRDAGSPDAADITAILRKSEREPVVLSLSDDGHESVRHLLELRIGDRPEPMSVFVVALTIVAVLVAVFLLFMRLLDDHPIVFVIVMVVITFLVFNFLLSLGGVA